MKKKLLSAITKKILTLMTMSVGALLFFTFYFGITISNLGPAFTFGLFLLPVTMGTIQVFSFHLIPKYLFRQKYLLFGLYTLYTLIISVFLIAISSFYGFLFLNSLEAFDSEFLLNKNLYLIIIGVYIVVLLSALFSAFRENHKIHLSNQKLQLALINGELQLKQEELAYLKMQIHPHFLFNTLNTIYGSAIAKNNQTPALILKLSNLLDYILYQTKKSLVPLQSEIDHLQDYLALEKLRHGDKLEIKASFPDDNVQLQIAPMLFLPLLENSFKHGKTQGNQTKVELKIETEENQIHFFLKNNYEEGASSTSLNSSGIGLQNIQKRLDLLYPKSHEFTFGKSNGYFTVNLSISANQPKSS
ncbi:histidine kinase [Algoriphagus halophytocola]|uniref:Histidine kinase n=1 Tax=Algoriphagus halophytocola TaxID=2991499 RepID=A0ABY6MGM1_9BACT|nr:MULTISPECIES: histidine kinase [unclassified Algoriphagus]UZD22788.1 histidine kinase [Algoriphagus sp. TR-M5]WBL44054.1 histidine kinase [Algoriphagus sp. TR-M9]